MAKPRGRSLKSASDTDIFEDSGSERVNSAPSASITRSYQNNSPDFVEKNSNAAVISDSEGDNNEATSDKPIHIKRFSGRVRAKSTASFKNLTKGFSHDIMHESEAGTKHGSFKKSKSTDLLFKRRNFSYLNMTSYNSNKPNEIGDTLHNIVNNSNTNINTGGLKPRRSKSTHAVLELHEADEMYTNDLTTDEEVEYFTEEDEEQGAKKPNSIINKNLPSQQIGGHSERLPNHDLKATHPAVNSKLFNCDNFENNSIADKHLPNINRNPNITKQLSYKPPSNLIKPTNSKNRILSSTTSNNDQLNTEIHDNEKISNTEARTSTTDNEEDNEEDNEDGLEENEVDEDDEIGDDHIGNIPIDEVIKDTVEHSLKRQVNMFSELQNSNILRNDNLSPVDPDSQSNDELPPNDNYIKSGAGHTDQYVPNMILSQSMGMEKRFDEPSKSNSSMQQLHEMSQIPEGKVLSMAKEEYNGVNDAMYTGARNHELQSFQQPDTSHNDFFDKISTTRNKNDTMQSFPNSISSLTNNLQKSTSEGFFPNNKIMNSPNSKQLPEVYDKTSTVQSPTKKAPTSSLLRQKPVALDSSMNNFANFLKSDDIDGDSRTQKKLWLQRENSILDLNLQNEENSAIFMATNINVKREFERVSHEYINLRRFCNPLNDALLRLEPNLRGNSQINSNISTPNDLNELLFSNYNSKTDDKFKEFLPSAEYANLNRTLAALWADETNKFNKEKNPLSKSNKLEAPGNNILKTQTALHSLRSIMGSSTALHHQRNINSLQPTTRAVNRRLENSLNISHR